ncbi:hypothetical protein [Paenibacillus ihuae]|uniref:hypothetical protein n=1 Tax=Paenibacillus ihuae TaxID=1232431 RepID=UPI0006D5780D|nr:hypothetical protein [Paenibacillus ihuae]
MQITQKGLSPIRTTIQAAGAILSLSLLLGCSSQKSSISVAATFEAAPSTSPASTPSGSSAATDPAQLPENTEGITSQFPLEGLASSVIIDSVNDAQTIRARTAAGQGELLMISSGPEERGHLNVSSNYGLEGEQTYQADYSIVYRKGNQDLELSKLPAFLFVQPTDCILDFARVSFKEADMYLPTPQYKSGHGLVGYAFAIDKRSGEAFPLSFVQDGIVQDTLVYAELQPAPVNDHEQLVVFSPVGAGGEPELEPRVYILDLVNHQFVARKN